MEVASMHNLSQKVRRNMLNTVGAALLAGYGFPMGATLLLLGVIFGQKLHVDAQLDNLKRKRAETKVVETSQTPNTTTPPKKVLAVKDLQKYATLGEFLRLGSHFGLCLMSGLAVKRLFSAAGPSANTTDVAKSSFANTPASGP